MWRNLHTGSFFVTGGIMAIGKYQVTGIAELIVTKTVEKEIVADTTAQIFG